MASYNNIFEVLQKVAENASSSEKLFGILKENGYKGTLEDAGREILKAEQVVLENLTSDDLKNIAGGKSLMNEKLKKIIAVGGASLMAGSATVPTQAAKKNLSQDNTSTKLFNHIKDNTIHTAITGGFAMSTGVLAAISLLLGHEIRQTKNKGNNETISAEKLIDILKSIPRGQELIRLLSQELDQEGTGEEVTLKLNKEEYRSGLIYTNPENVKIKIEAGKDKQGGLCANHQILCGLKDQTKELGEIANEITDQVTGKKTTTKQTEQKEEVDENTTYTDKPAMSDSDENKPTEYEILIRKAVVGWLVGQIQKQIVTEQKEKEILTDEITDDEFILIGNSEPPQIENLNQTNQQNSARTKKKTIEGKIPEPKKKVQNNNDMKPPAGNEQTNNNEIKESNNNPLPSAQQLNSKLQIVTPNIIEAIEKKEEKQDMVDGDSIIDLESKKPEQPEQSELTGQKKVD